MSLVNFDVEIQVETAVRSDNVTVFVGATHYPPDNCTAACPGHYMLTMAITPRPPHAWASLGDDSTMHPTTMGELMLIPPGYAQRGGFRPQSGWRRDIFCLFPQRRFEEFMGGQIDWTRSALCATTNIRDAHIHAGTRRLAQEATTPGLASSILMDSLAATVAVDVRRYFGGGEKLESAQKFPLSAKQLEIIRDFIYDNAQENLRLVDFAEICGLSVRHLTRAFKHTTGQTLASHVAEIRVEIAKQLLGNTNLPAKVIAAKVGFSNVSSFGTAFRNLTGVTPRMYRSGGAVAWGADDLDVPD